MRKDRKNYYKNYYKKNKRRLQKKKGDRYQNDPEYREKALTRSSIQASLSSLSAEEVVETVIHNGVEETAYLLGEVIPLLNRQKGMIYKWRAEGIIPNTSYRDNRDRVLYAHSQVLLLEIMMRKIDNREVKLDPYELGDILAKVWNETFTEKTLEGLNV